MCVLLSGIQLNNLKTPDISHKLLLTGWLYRKSFHKPDADKSNPFLKWYLLGIYQFVGTYIAFFKNIGRILSIYLVVILILLKLF